MMNLNNREEAVMLAKELQGMDIKEALDYVRELSSIDYGCTVSVDVQDASSEDVGTFWMYIKLMLLDEDREILTENIGLEQLGVVATVTPSKNELCEVIKDMNFNIDVNQEMEDIIETFTNALYFEPDLNVFENFAEVSYQWEVWPADADMVDWNDLEEECEMEYRNIIEELMDTKVKELLNKPFGAVMDLNQIRCINLDILAGHAEILTWRLWQEILSNDAVETLEVIEKWDVEENSHFLVLDKDQDDNMTGIFIDGFPIECLHNAVMTYS